MKSIDTHFKKMHQFTPHQISYSNRFNFNHLETRKKTKQLLQYDKERSYWVVIDTVLLRSHEERRWLCKEPTQIRISPKTLKHTKIYFIADQFLNWLNFRVRWFISRTVHESLDSLSCTWMTGTSTAFAKLVTSVFTNSGTSRCSSTALRPAQTKSSKPTRNKANNRKTKLTTKQTDQTTIKNQTNQIKGESNQIKVRRPPAT